MIFEKINSNFYLITLIAFAFSALAVWQWIRFSGKESFVQPIREDGNKEHYKKQGTPMMGGVAFLTVFLLLMILFCGINARALLILFSTLGFMAIGFLDDYEKAKKKVNEGLTPRQKLYLQFALATVIAIWNYLLNPEASTQVIPFFGWKWNLGVIWIPIFSFIIVGTANSVNLTDGLDGLCTGVSIPVFFAIAVAGTSLFSTIPEISIGGWIMVGVLLGFLIFNSHPASVFMGDTGSMGIGGALVALLLLQNHLLYLILLGGVYLMETLSDLIQFSYFRKTGGKRIFLMAPVHHHFELKGYPEEKVAMSFSLFSAALALCYLWIA